MVIPHLYEDLILWSHHVLTAGSFPLTEQTKPSKSPQPTWPTGTLSTLSWLSIELLTSFMSPHSVLSWNTLSLSSFGTITLINSRNLFVSDCVFGIYSNSNQVWCAMLFLSEIAGLSMPAAWRSFSFTVFGNLFSSLFCCLIESSAELPDVTPLIFAMSFGLFLPT